SATHTPDKPPIEATTCFGRRKEVPHPHTATSRVGRASCGKNCESSSWSRWDDLSVAVCIGYDNAGARWAAVPCKGESRCRRPLTSHVRTLHMSWSREADVQVLAAITMAI